METIFWLGLVAWIVLVLIVGLIFWSHNRCLVSAYCSS